MGEGIAQGGRADELEDLIEMLVRLKDAVPVLDDASVAGATQQLVLCEVPCRACKVERRMCCHKEACRGNADRACGAADQDMARGFHLQALDRPIGGISGLADGGKLFPGKIGCNRIDLPIRNECILCIAAIEGTSHLAHEGDDLLAVRQPFRIGRLGNLARAHYAQDSREGDRRGEALPREDLRMVEAEGADADERPPERT